MPKDLKIGLFLGMLLVMIAAVWLFLGPGLPQKARRPKPHDTFSQEEIPGAPNNLSTNNTTADGRENRHLSTTANQLTSSDLTIREDAEEIKTEKFHTIREGETLSDISRIYYGSANEWQKIYDANRETITNVNKLRPGTKIIIPE